MSSSPSSPCPHPQHGGQAISLAERQLHALRDKIRALELNYELIRFGEENDDISTKVHRLAVALLHAGSVAAVRRPDRQPARRFLRALRDPEAVELGGGVVHAEAFGVADRHAARSRTCAGAGARKHRDDELVRRGCAPHPFACADAAASGGRMRRPARARQRGGRAFLRQHGHALPGGHRRPCRRGTGGARGLESMGSRRAAGAAPEAPSALPARMQAWLDWLATQRRVFAADPDRLPRRAARPCCAWPRSARRRSLQPPDIRRFVARLHGEGQRGRSIARHLSAWRGFYRWLVREHGVRVNPALGIRPPKSPSTLPRVLSPEQANALARS